MTDNVLRPSQLRRELAEAAAQPPGGGRGGGTYDGMEPRVAALEAHFQHIKDDVAEIRKDVRELRGDLKTDFRWLLAGGNAAVIALAALMSKGFHWL